MDKKLLLRKYLKKVPHLCGMVIDHKKSGERKIQLTMKLKFINRHDSNGKRTVYSRSDSSKVMIDNNTNEIIKKYFNPLLDKYRIGLEQFMRGNNFCF